MIVSIFNDVIGPVMRGPSSSHCAAALRIGRLARDLMDGGFQPTCWSSSTATARCPPPTTRRARTWGLFGGLMGWDAADARLPDSPQALRDTGVRIAIETVDAGDPHPNTYRLTLRSERGDPHPACDFHRRRNDGGDRSRRLRGLDVRRLFRNPAVGGRSGERGRRGAGVPASTPMRSCCTRPTAGRWSK